MDAKALRQKILDLAIRGKLVPQDPNDDPASVLLERIRAQKQQMVNEGKLKAKDIKNDTIIFKGEDNLHYEKFQDGSIKCIEDEIPFEIPDSWVWTRLGNIYAHNTGKALNVSDTAGLELTYITTSNLYWDRFELSTLKKMYFTESELEKCTVTNGDLLVCEGGDIGRAAIWTYDENIRIQNHIHRLRAFIPLANRFYYYVFYLWKLIDKIGGQGIGLQGFSSKALHNLIAPVPPLQEQHNIADKLDIICAIVNNVEKTKEDVKEIIEQVKSRILDLAIRGKLVPQDPNDEPASVLLERIRAEKEELIKQGKIKRDKKESVIIRGEDNSYYEKIGEEVHCIDDEIPFEIPGGWAWTRLLSIADIVMGSSPKSESICRDVSYIEFHQGKIYFSKKLVGYSGQHSKEITKIAPPGSVLLCVRAPVGIVNITNRAICIGRGLSAIHPCVNIDVDFLFYWLQPFKDLMNKKATGSTFSAITTDVVRNLLIPLPTQGEQKRILSLINSIDMIFANIEASLS